MKVAAVNASITRLEKKAFFMVRRGVNVLIILAQFLG
jgi:hypothetical protein